MPTRRLSFLAIALSVALLQRPSADSSAQSLPFSQDWTNTGLITTSVTELPTPTSWPGVPGIIGFTGNGLTALIGADPQTLLNDDAMPIVNVIANLTNVAITAGGVGEFELPNPVVALQGSATADAPYLLIHLDTTGRSNITVSYNVRDIDSTADNTNQQVALHYRVGSTGPFTNVAAAYVADATSGPGLATQVTPVSVTLPAAVNNQPLLQLRIMTTNSPGSDEWVGIDDIRVEESLVPTPPTGIGLATPATVSAGDETLLTVTVTPGTNPPSTGLTVNADLSAIGGFASQPFSDDGVTGGDVTADDNIFTFLATVPSTTAPGPRILPATIVDSNFRIGMASISLTVEAPVLEMAIHEIQGGGVTSPVVGQRVRTTGIVTGIRTGGLGFYIQTPDSEVDADAETSQGLLIFRRPAPGVPIVDRGDLVEITGLVSEFPSANPDARRVTEISTDPAVRIISRGHPLPAAITLTAADTPANGPLDALEEFEGMRVRVEALHVVAPTQGSVVESSATASSTGVFFGVIDGHSASRPMREPGLDPFEPEPPGLPLCVPPNPCVPLFDGNPERIRVDSDEQVGALGLEVAAGQVVSGLVGPLNYDFDAYTIALDPVVPPASGYEVTPQPEAIWVSTPGVREFTIASANLQRLYDTVDDPGTSDVVMSTVGFATRLSKLSLLVRNVLQTPDILGVSEAENLVVLQALAAKVNADAVAAGQDSPDYVAYLEEGNDPGGIDVGFLVKTSRVSVVDVMQVELPNCVRTIPTTCNTYIFNGNPELLNDRPPLVLRAVVGGPEGAEFPMTVIANHLRSLNDVTDPVDGPRVREKRRAQAEFLANVIQARQIGDANERIVVLGDMNAFQFNDGLVDSIGTIKGTPTPPTEVLLASLDLVDPDLLDLGESVSPDQRYSFVFDGNAQQLDHMLVTQNLAATFSGLEYGRANADFPESLRNDPTRPERISDHDPLVAYFTIPVSLSIDDVTVTEGDQGVTQARFTVTRQGSSEDDVTVEFTTEDGGGENGAIAGFDYITREGMLTFQPGETTQTIVVDVIGERLFEPDELFFVRLSSAGPHASIERAVGTGTITNDDPQPSLSIENAEVHEGNDGSTTATFTVSLSNPSASTITVDFATADGTARQPSDYLAAAGVLEFAPGETTETVTVTVNGDLLDEPDETFAVNLSNAENATILDGQGIGTIRDNDPRPTIRIRNARADEPSEGTVLMPFHVELSAPSGKTVTVDFRTFNLTAVAGRDYEARTGTLTFAPGETEQTIDVPILADHPREFVEVFLVLLHDPENAIAADAIGIGIIDDARGPHIDSFSPASGRAGSIVTINGDNFTHALLVKFNGVPTLFHVDNPTRIRAIVPRGALSGPISVTTLRGTDTSAANFTVLR